MLFNILKKAIERGNYTNKEDMAEKVSILFANNQITIEQFEILIDMLDIDK